MKSMNRFNQTNLILSFFMLLFFLISVTCFSVAFIQYKNSLCPNVTAEQSERRFLEILLSQQEDHQPIYEYYFDDKNTFSGDVMFDFL